MNFKVKYRFKDVITFILVFSFFNDGFLGDLFGDNILKLIFLIFITFNIRDIFKNMKYLRDMQDILLIIFSFWLITFFLINTLVKGDNDLFSVSILLFALFVIILFFKHYSLEKLLYFIWLSIASSIVICFFNDPVSQWSFRTTGGTGDANEYATHVLMFIYISLYLYNKNKNKMFIFISISLFIYGLFMAGSKSAFLVFAITIIFYFIKDFKKIFNYKTFLILVILVISSSFIDFTKLQLVSNMLSRTDETGTAYSRINSWIAGYHMVEENPILGVGINCYADNTRKYAETMLADGSLAPHNMYIKIIAESGIIVFISFIVFLAFLMLHNRKIIFESQYKFLWFSVFSTLLMGLSLGITYEKYLWLEIAMLMQLHFTIDRRKNENITSYS